MDEPALPESLPGIDLPTALRLVAGNRKLFGRILLEFAVSCRDASKEIGDLLACDDRDGSIRLAHSIKGNAGIIGAGGLQQAARDLEQSLLEDDGQKREEALAGFRRELKLILDTVDYYQSYSTEVQHGDATS